MPTPALRSSLAADLRISVMRLSRRMRAERMDTDLGLSHLSVLATLDRHGPLTPGELAAHERVRPPSMTKLLTLLTDRGLLDRTPDPHDRRQVVISLTPEARGFIKKERARREAWLTQQLAALTVEERRILAEAAPLIERLAGS